jgi:hypothetical protein
MAQSLARFDEALAQAAEGRRMHVAAAVELEVVAGDVVQIVRVIDGLNRFRFSGDPDLFAAWRSASNVVGPSHPAAKPDSEAPPSEGAVKPAA